MRRAKSAVRSLFTRSRIHLRYVRLRYASPFSAVANPWRIRWVNPSRITHVTAPDSENSRVRDPTESVYVYGLQPGEEHYFAMVRGGFDTSLLGSIESGDWDQGITKFEEIPSTKALRAYFEEGVDWHDTAYARTYEKWMERGYRDKPPDYLETYRQRNEALFASMQSEGYRPQEAIGGEFFHNIGVNIGRDGELLFNTDGHHRLAIAKILGLDQVAVIVIVRHTQWQRIRDTIATTPPSELSEELRTFLGHPDLVDIRSAGPANRISKSAPGSH